MLTFQELKRITDVLGHNKKLPTAKQLRKAGLVVVQESIGKNLEISVYRNGYVLYRVENHSTVFPLHSCGDYLYLTDRKAVHLPEQFFNNEDWYLRLVLEGEDRLNRNLEEKERSWNISYSTISEDCAIMENLTESMMDYLVKQETVTEILRVLTERQKDIIQKYYLQEETQEQISRELGISQQAVSSILSQAVGSIRKKYSSFCFSSGNTILGGESMSGMRPKERDYYVLRMADGTLMEVTREVYLEWYQSRRREKYQKEQSWRNGICSLNELEEKRNLSGVFVNVGEDLEETVLRNICCDKVREVLGNLSAEDARLIELLYFMEVTVTDAAQIFGCSRRTIQNRRKRILKELFQKMQEQGVQGGLF